MSLLEALLALILVAMGLLVGVSLVLSGSGLAAQNGLSADGTDTLRQVVEEIQGMPVGEVYARFNDDPDDDPEGPGTAPGSRFTLPPALRGPLLDTAAVAAMAASPTERGARSVPIEIEVSFPVDTGGALSETAADPAWGNDGWDLNGDGEITSGDRSTDYVLLPVRVRVRWDSGKGEGVLEVVRLLSSR